MKLMAPTILRSLAIAGGIAAMVTCSLGALAASSHAASRAPAERTHLSVRHTGDSRLAQRSHQTAGGVTMSTVPMQVFAARGVVLDTPRGTPGITRDAVIQVVRQRFWGHGATIREMVLADVRPVGAPAGTGRPEWLISLLPAGGTFPAGDGGAIRLNYLLEFVDAESGQLLGGVGGGS